MDIHTHYGFFYTLQGFYPRGIILRAPRPLSKEDCEQYNPGQSLPETRGDDKQHIPKHESSIYMYVCQAFFDFSSDYYCDWVEIRTRVFIKRISFLIQKIPLNIQMLEYPNHVVVKLLSSFEGCYKESHFIPDLLPGPK